MVKKSNELPMKNEPPI